MPEDKRSMIGYSNLTPLKLLGRREIRQIYRALTPANRLDGIVGLA